MLDNVEAYREILISAGAIEERLINEIEATISIKKESGVLYQKIENLQKEVIIPAEIASYLHTIRIFANKARHTRYKGKKKFHSLHTEITMAKLQTKFHIDTKYSNSKY
ncbi:MAG: DUF4145 domain-containing protein [Candidatus Aminicenantes bacterium]|nr:DUF4145 domain-containing protein [Candidatus Aminicenantes bacterium]